MFWLDRSWEGGTFQIMTDWSAGQAEPKETDSSQTQRAETRMNGAHVLLVDDDARMRGIIALILQRAGCTVVEAGDGEEGIRIVGESQKEFDVVITDAIMEPMGGKEFSEKLEILRPGMKLLMCSGHPSDVLARHGIQMDSGHFLAKPFSATEMLQKVNEVLGA